MSYYFSYQNQILTWHLSRGSESDIVLSRVDNHDWCLLCWHFLCFMYFTMSVCYSRKHYSLNSYESDSAAVKPLLNWAELPSRPLSLQHLSEWLLWLSVGCRDPQRNTHSWLLMTMFSFQISSFIHSFYSITTKVSISHSSGSIWPSSIEDTLCPCECPCDLGRGQSFLWDRVVTMSWQSDMPDDGLLPLSLPPAHSCRDHHIHRLWWRQWSHRHRWWA